MASIKKITFTKNGKTKVSQSALSISEILNSLYMQHNIKDEDIIDGVVNSSDLTWLDIKTKTLTIRVEIESCTPTKFIKA